MAQMRDTSTTNHDIDQIQKKDWFKSSSISADYTVNDNDKIKRFFVTTGAGNVTITLPTAADNTDRVIEAKKVDAGAGNAILDGEGAETIDGVATYTLAAQYDSITIACDGTQWFIID